MKEHYNRVLELNELDPAPISERGMKLTEEVGELAKEVNRTTGRKKSKLSVREVREAMLGEAADSIQCIFSVLHQYNTENPIAENITYGDLVERVGLKNEKWFNTLD